MKVDKSLEMETDFNPYYKMMNSGLKTTVNIGDEEYIDLASNNYLGLANDERIVKHSIVALKKYGLSMCGTPIASGYIDLYENVQFKLARFVNLDRAVLLPSCYQANNGLFKAITKEKDLILIDHYAHSSLIEGAQATSGKIRLFLHNNILHLEKLLEKREKYKNVFIVTESVFSTEGEVIDINKYIEIAKKYSAYLVVDDSHGIGIIGPQGKGILSDIKTEHDKIIYTASLGKGLANQGGIIAGNNELMEYISYYLPQLIYSTALVPAVLGGIDKTIDIITNEFPQIKNKLDRNSSRLKSILKQLKFDIVETSMPITSIKAGNSKNAFTIAKNFYSKKILTTTFITPSVPQNQSRIRLIANAGLREEDMNKLEDKIREMVL
ncbi:aminotransferase class I/II-fold pyridoxal phosphate-dependent enzyme [Alkaliphilus peptidifermentans]|uniref:Glycine C-acetyltransferase n=1 Tax=Alkaliphilus peptidifermentans DSM 18978 TaxID=1120976 RepID=A0A1G5IAA8_9FIRM|nr:aminotransferase class I/II-fold pyridoxal phosphate-dependent enzyme [Alkaliphilus peptidifermentans]SCY72721.1 glycine C-acetyltransferase [Alkaliphilus peptidifermentans DSM 18978]